jgi:hypothetical protein
MKCEERVLLPPLSRNPLDPAELLAVVAAPCAGHTTALLPSYKLAPPMRTRGHEW